MRPADRRPGAPAAVAFAEVRPGVFRAVVEPEGVTVGLVAGPRGGLLIDCGAGPALGADIRAAAEAVLDGPLTGVVVTHGHWDHAFGLTAFADLETIGHEDAGSALRGPAAARAAAAAGLDLADLPGPRTVIASIGLRDLGGVAVELAHFGTAHTRGDLVVAVPEAKVVFAGDLVETAGPPQFDEESSPGGWARTLDALVQIARPGVLVVPGHGPVADGGEVARQRSGLAALWGQAEWAWQQGVPVDEAYGCEGLEWPWDRATAEHGIALTYAELAARERRPKRRLPVVGLP